MSPWKLVDSPKLRIPFELREVTTPGTDERVWEVQELRTGCMFVARLAAEQVDRTRRGGATRRLNEAEIERAVCLSVEEALLSPPDKEPGETYETTVDADQLHEAASLSR